MESERLAAQAESSASASPSPTATSSGPTKFQIVRIAPRPEAGFQAPYFLYTPQAWKSRAPSAESAPKKKAKAKKVVKKTKKKAAKKKSANSKNAKKKKSPKKPLKAAKKKKPQAIAKPAPPPIPLIPGRLLVLPTDDGSVANVRPKLLLAERLGEELGVAVLVPGFPAGHGLGREGILAREGNSQRLDLQLVAMIENARERILRHRVEVDHRVLLWGFGTAGRFANRFALIHPERVRAVAVGSPGTFMLPSSRFSGEDLRYPIGIADLQGVAERGFFRQAFEAMPMLLYIGEKDEVDPAEIPGEFDPADRDRLVSLFGRSPTRRWSSVLDHYERAKCDCLFQVYEGLSDEQPEKVEHDVLEFLKQYVKVEK